MPALRVSIAIATCNGERYLRQQLDSIAANSRTPQEIVLVDDCLTDHTVGIAHEFARRAPCMVRIESNTERLGFNGTFQRAASLADADVVLFCDQDDVWLPNHVESLVAPFDCDRAVAVVVSDSLYVDVDLRPIGQTLWTAERFGRSDLRRARSGWQFPGWARHRAVAGHAMAVRADLRPVMLPFGATWTYDHWLGLTAAACGTLVLEPRPLTLHRQHDRQALGHSWKRLVDMYWDDRRLDVGYFSRRIAQWHELRNRLAAHASVLRDERVIDVIDAQIAFLGARRTMRLGGWINRFVGATAELVRGDYHRYGRGLLTYTRDVAG